MDQPTDQDTVLEERRLRKQSYNHEYYLRNRDQSEEQKERSREWQTRYRERHRERIAAARGARYRERMLSDPQYRDNLNATAKRKRERVKNDPDRLAARRLNDREYMRRKRKDPEWRARKGEQRRRRLRLRYATDEGYRREAILRVSARKPWDKTVTVASIEAMLEAQKGRCVTCKADIRDGFHLDHIYPQSRGGESTLANLQLLCPPCNMAKRDRTAFSSSRL